MVTPTANIERERLLKLAEEYRNQGYEIGLYPNPEDLPFREDIMWFDR